MSGLLYVTGPRREVGGVQPAGADPHPERARCQPVQAFQRVTGSSVPVAQVENAEPFGPAHRRGEPGVGFAERGDADDHVLGTHSRRHDSPNQAETAWWGMRYDNDGGASDSSGTCGDPGTPIHKSLLETR